MKKIILLLTISILFLTSCDDNKQPLTPEENLYPEILEEEPINDEEEDSPKKPEEKVFVETTFLNEENIDTFPEFPVDGAFGMYSNAITIYRYDVDNGYYYTTLSMEPYPNGEEPGIYETLFRNVSKGLPTFAFPKVQEATVVTRGSDDEAQTITLFWNKEYMETLTDEQKEQLFASTSTSIYQGRKDIDDVKHNINNTIVGINGKYTPPEISFDPVYQELYKKEREMITYVSPEDNSPDKENQLHEHFNRVIYSVGPITDPIDSPEDLDPIAILQSAIDIGYRNRDFDESTADLPLLKEKLSYLDMVPKENVNRFIEDSFGNSLSVNHETVAQWFYHPEFELYAPPHIGGNALMVEMISVEEMNNTFVVQVVFYSGYDESPDISAATHEFIFHDVSNKLPQFKSGKPL